MTSLLVQILIALITILGSGVVAAAVNHLFIRAREDRVAQKKRAEELFLAVGHYSNLLYNNSIWYLHCMQGKMDYMDVVDGTTKLNSADDSKRHFPTVEMMVSLHFPSLHPHLKAYRDKMMQLELISINFKKHYEDVGRDKLSPSYASTLITSLNEIQGLEDKFKKDIVQLSKSI